MCSNVAIEVKNVSKCYHIYDKPQDRLKQMIMRGKRQYFREFWALKNINFTIEKAQTIGIIGRNGSGKSTLLQIICQTVPATQGTVTVNGRVAALLELGAGFNLEFTGRENVLLNAAILGFSKQQMLERMHDVLAFSELGDFLDQPIKTYSSGMFARLAFATAIHVDPDILIIDEALAVGDVRFVAKCMNRIKQMQQQGVTIVFVSHDVNSIRTLCERVIWLNQGALVEHGDVFPVTGRYMEFMCQDDEPEPYETSQARALQDPDQHLDQDNGSGNGPNIPAGDSLVSEIVVDIHGDEGISAPEVIDQQQTIQSTHKPVTHWGSHKDLIKSAAIYNEHRQRRDLYQWGELLRVIIDVDIPPQIDREHLSVAFSIKNLKGIDLIVSTTHDFSKTLLPKTNRFAVCFELSNPLVDGQYILVAAIENRQQQDIHYYEYIEGAHYFSSHNESLLFGLIHPPIQQSIKVQ